MEETMITDGAYGGTENQEIAKTKNVKLVTTVLTLKQSDIIISEFKLSDDGREVLSCPMGNKPIKCSYYESTNMCRAIMNKDDCKNCPNRSKCKVKTQKKTAFVLVSTKMVERANYLKELSTEEYIELAHIRNGA